MSNFNSIDNFKTNFKGGTRPNRFSVTANWPTGIGADSSFLMNKVTSFKISSVRMPESKLSTIPTYYRGRRVNFAGDRSYGQWRISVLDDTDNYSLWKIFHTWMEKIDGHQSHLYSDGPYYTYSKHQCSFTLNQYDLNGTSDDMVGTTGIRTIVLKNVWPSAVGEIALDMKEGSIVEFAVDLFYDYITFEGSTIKNLPQ